MGLKAPHAVTAAPGVGPSCLRKQQVCLLSVVFFLDFSAEGRSLRSRRDERGPFQWCA